MLNYDVVSFSLPSRIIHCYIYSTDTYILIFSATDSIKGNMAMKTPYHLFGAT